MQTPGAQPKVRAHAQQKNSHGEINIKTTGYEWYHVHVPHKLEKHGFSPEFFKVLVTVDPYRSVSSVNGVDWCIFCNVAVHMDQAQKIQTQWWGQSTQEAKNKWKFWICFTETCLKLTWRWKAVNFRQYGDADPNGNICISLFETQCNTRISTCKEWLRWKKTEGKKFSWIIYANSV